MAVDYKACLCNVTWDNSYDDVVNFDNDVDKRAYFASLVDFTTAIPVNFNFKDCVNTEIIYRLPTSINLIEALNKNYCVIYNSVNDSFLYFFITKNEQDSGLQLKLTLELDIFTTYFIPEIGGDCIFERAHLNRFTPIDTLTYTYDNTLNSKFIYDNGYSAKPRLSSREKLNNKSVGGGVLWYYLYCEPRTYNINNNNTIPIPVAYIDGISTDAGLICVGATRDSEFSTIEIYQYDSQSNSYIYKGINTPFSINTFRQLNNDSSYFYSLKVSHIPPFSIIDYTASVNGILKLYIGRSYNCNAFDMGTGSCLISLHSLNSNGNLFRPYNSVNLVQNMPELSSHEIRQHSNEYSPIFLSNMLEYYSITIGNRKFDVNEFAVSNKRNPPEIHELTPITNDICGGIIALTPHSDSIVGSNIGDFYYGLNYKFSQNINIRNDQLQAYLAQNKNFFLQADATRQYNLESVEISKKAENTKGLNALGYLPGKALSGDLGGMLSTIPDMATHFINSYTMGQQADLDYKQSLLQQDYNVANMGSAPDTLASADNDIYSSVFYKDNNFPRINRYSLLQADKQRILSSINRFGYVYPVIDTIANNYNTRKYWNYVKCNIDTIAQDFSLQIKQAFRNAFSKGVRIWHYNSGNWGGIDNYSQQNYERYLD